MARRNDLNISGEDVRQFFRQINRQSAEPSSRQTTRQTPRQREQNLEAVVENRYDRQELIEGWNQEKLTNAKVIIAGSDILANYVAMSLSALGFGSIEIYGAGKTSGQKARKQINEADYSEGFIFPPAGESRSKADLIAEFANKINPAVEAYGINLDLARENNLNVLNGADIIIDASNDAASKKELIDYAASNKCLFISISSHNYAGKLGVFNPNWRRSKSAEDLEKILGNILFYDMHGKKQDPTTGMAIGALAADEARKYIMPINNEKVIEDVVVHSLYSEKRFDNSKDMNINEPDSLKNKKVLMIGAGALGNFMGLGLAMAGIGELIIFDKDVVEETNLNRQPFFYNSVGRSKVPALIRELRKINHKVKYTGIEEFIDLSYENFFRNNKIDLIVDCVDNDKARALLNYYSNKYKIPLISSATAHNSGHVNVSVPGKTACLNCQREIDKYAVQGEQRAAQQAASCIYAPQASVITSNIAIAGIALAEA